MTLPRYAEYKDSGVAWLGKLPSHWALGRVKHVTGSIEQGWSPQCEGFPVEAPDEWGVMKVGCVNGGRFRPSENKKLPAELQPMPQYALKRGDLLISRANTRELVGSAAVVQDDFHNLLLCDKLYRLRTSEGMSQASYLAYFLGTREARSQIELDATGASSSMLNIGQSAILDLLMPRPSRAEQAAIATFLDCETAKIDALIAEQQKLIALLAEKRQATISHAVTRGLNPDASMKDSGVAWLGAVPAHWDVVPLKYVVELRSGGTPSKDNLDYWDGNIPWASAKDLKVERLGSTTDHITQAALESGAASVVRKGAILVVVRGMILARMFPVVETLVPMAINQDLKAVLPHSRLNASFLAWLLRGSADESLQRLDEAGHGTKALRMDAWTSMQLPIPPLEEQVLVAEFIAEATARLDALRAEAARAIGLLTERRSALIAAAVTGQIDVRGA